MQMGLRWNMGATRDLVRQVHGDNQLKLASPSINSLHGRLEFAQIHYGDAKALLSSKLTDRDLMEVLFLDEDGGELHPRISAYVTAALQSLHAIEDTAAHAVYYSLALNKAPKPLSESAVRGESVLELIAKEPAYAGVRDVLADLDHSVEADHLDALVNISKHRNIVRTSINQDYTGQRAERNIVLLEAVQYKGKSFPEVTVSDFMSAQFARCNLLIVKLGNELNAVLSAARP